MTRSYAQITAAHVLDVAARAEHAAQKRRAAKREKLIEADPFARDRERAKVRAATVLRSAADIIEGDRAEQHGDKAVSFGRIALMWQAHLDVRREDGPLTGEDVALMMVLMKLVRSQSGEWNEDDFVDLCGYGACAAELSSPQV